MAEGSVGGFEWLQCNTEFTIKVEPGILAPNLAHKTRCSSLIHSSAPRAFASRLRGPSAPLLRRSTPTSSRYQHDVLQGLRHREAIFQHGLHGVELSEFSGTEKRDDRERERRSPTTTSRRTTRPRSRPSSKPSSRTRRGRQLARSTANGPAAR